MKSNYKLLPVLALVLAWSASGSALAQSVGIFADVGYVSTDAEGVGDHFGIGAMDLYANKHISDKTNAFFELVFENDGEGFVVDVERYWLTREIDPAFKIGAGRYHAPLGYWNRNYHHGVLIQNTVSRPAFLDFEDGEAAILPMHIIGLMANGEFGDGFTYQLSAANSTSYDTGAGLASGEILLGNVGDGSNAKTVLGHLSYNFADTPLELGIFGMSNDMLEASVVGTGGVDMGAILAQTTVWGANVFYDQETVDFLAEYYYLDNTDKTGGVVGVDGTGTAFYIQAGYRFNDRWRVTYRYEDLSLDDNVGYFNILGTEAYSANVGALRFEVDESSALMLEYNSKDNETSADVNEIALNWAFMVF